MRRRDFIAMLGAAATAWPLVARAQQAGKVARLGFLGLPSASERQISISAFLEGLRELGYVEGQNITIEYRWADGRLDRLPELAAELVRLKVDVIVTHGTPGGFAAKRATTTVPVVVAAASDMAKTGLVESLARPGGNVTGLTFPDLMAKRLQLLKEAFAGITRVAVLLNPNTPPHRLSLEEMELAARSLGMELQPVEVRAPGDFDRAFMVMGERRANGLVIPEDGMITGNLRRIVELAAKIRLPAIGNGQLTEAGGLMSYGTHPHDLWRRAATFVYKILKGAKPADLPVEHPTKFLLVINLKIAAALGLTFPDSILLRADKVIE